MFDMAPRSHRPEGARVRRIVDDYRKTHGGYDPAGLCEALPLTATRWERLGKMVWIRYSTAKAFDGEGEAIYEHEFGEDGAKNKPVLFRGGSKAAPQYLILGGGYSVEDGGITDDLDDWREAPYESFSRSIRHPSHMAGMGRMHSVDLTHGRRISFVGKGYLLAYSRGRSSTADQLWIMRARCTGGRRKWSR